MKYCQPCFRSFGQACCSPESRRQNITWFRESSSLQVSTFASCCSPSNPKLAIAQWSLLSFPRWHLLLLLLLLLLLSCCCLSLNPLLLSHTELGRHIARLHTTHPTHADTHTQMLFGHGKHKYGCSLKYGIINLQPHFTFVFVIHVSEAHRLAGILPD